MKVFFFALATVLIFTSPSALAGDIAAGKAKSALCASCHGPTGISMSPIWPNLAGQKEQYLVKQIKAFRSGDREDPMMAPMVAALSDADIDNLAAYYASQK
jgi:cytochrome c553